jgi:hypothetical protein
MKSVILFRRCFAHARDTDDANAIHGATDGHADDERRELGR